MTSAVLGYMGALGAGDTLIGWYALVVAIATSFWAVILGIHTQEHEQTAALLEYMLDLSKQEEPSSHKSTS